MFKITLPLEDYKPLEARYTAFCRRMETPLIAIQQSLRKALAAYGLSPTIRYRLKEFPSFYEKVLAKLREKEAGPGQEVILTDILGLRIICPFLEDTEKAIFILKKEFEIIEEERKVSTQFGYTSTHLLLSLPREINEKFNISDESVCEIQVRTILQDAWAEVEHEIIYKTEFSPMSEFLKRKLAALNATLTLSDIMFQEIRDDQRSLQSGIAQRRNGFIDGFRKTGDKETEAGESQESRDSQDYMFKMMEEKPSLEAGDVTGLPNSLDRLLMQALKEHNAGHFDQAEAIYTKIIDQIKEPKSLAIILMHRGMASFAQMGYTRALDDFTRAAKEDPGNAKPWYYRGIVNRVINRAEEALEDYNYSIALDPYQPEAILARAQLFFQNGDLAATLKDCRAVLSLNNSQQEAVKLHALVMERIYNKASRSP
jgi:putative GTP pyrophosphokinase